MPKRQKYRSYDPRVKAIIASTGRTDLFPDFKIPRMTARHWIKQGFAIDDPILESLTDAINDSHQKLEKMKQQL